MSYFLRLIFALALCLLPLPTCAQQKKPVRAVWVRPFIGAGPEVRRDEVKGRAFIRAELERLQSAGLDTAYVEALWDGYAIYPSRLAPPRPLAFAHGFAQPGQPGWDVLSAYIEEGQRLGIEVHAWLHVFHGWSTHLGAFEKSPLFSAHPDWAARDASGSPLVKSEAEGVKRDIFKVFLSPSHPEARKYLRALVAELCETHPRLRGVQWDYIRYPLHNSQQSFDYSDQALAAFERESGLDAKALDAQRTPREWKAWQDWKARQVSTLVEELAAIVREKRPGWEISAAVFPSIEENLRQKMQDWKSWAQHGWVDALLPMLYSRDFARVQAWARDFRRDVPRTVKIYPALFIGHFYNPASREMNAKYLEVETEFGFDGVGLFAAQSLTHDLIEKLKARR